MTTPDLMELLPERKVKKKLKFEEPKTSDEANSKKTKDSDPNPDDIGNGDINLKKLEDQFTKSNPQFDLNDMKLYDLEFIVQLKISKADLQILIVNNNYLSSIDILNKFDGLMKINAGHNYIASINLTLANLQELDLRNNTIARLPFFSKLPNLKILNMKSNKIENAILNFNKEKESKLEKLNLSFN